MAKGRRPASSRKLKAQLEAEASVQERIDQMLEADRQKRASASAIKPPFDVSDSYPSIDDDIADIFPDEQAMVEIALSADETGVIVPFKPGFHMPAKVENHSVTVIKDHLLTYPELWCSVYLAPEHIGERALMAQWFARAKCTNAATPEEADFVVFGGGVDVDPALYGVDNPHPRVDPPSPARDDADIELYKRCFEQGIPMIGICRGAQFLHVMNNGKLYQDVDGHYGDHSLFDVGKKEKIERISSVHHQMVQPNKGLEVIATAAKSRNRWKDKDTRVTGVAADIEAFWYRDTCCLGFQGHPEYRTYNYYAVWAMTKIQDLIHLSPDTEYRGEPVKVCRLKEDILNTRKAYIHPRIK